MADTPNELKLSTKPGSRSEKGLALRPSRQAMTPDETRISTGALLEFESPGAALLAVPVPARSRYTTYVIFALFLTMFLVALLMPIDLVVTGPGSIVTVEPQTGIAPLVNSAVRSILVHKGQVVHKGDLLMTLDPTDANADVANYKDHVASLTEEIRRLQAEVDGRSFLSDGSHDGDLQEQLYAQRHADITLQMASLDQQIAALQGQVNQAESDIRNYTLRLSTNNQIVGKRVQLQQLQVGSSLDTLAAQDQQQEIKRYLDFAQGNLIQQKNTLQAKISTRDDTLEQWRAQTAQSLKTQREALMQSQDQLDQALYAQQMVELRAPFDAWVFDVAPSNAGTVVNAGSQVIYLTPYSSALEAEVLVDAATAGFVRVGQRATVKFDTFPYVSHGFATGKVRALSSDSTRIPYQPLSMPAGLTQAQQQFGELYYKARITFEAINLVGVPPDFRPTPGMQLTIDVLGGHRTFIEYLFARVIPATVEAFREP